MSRTYTVEEASAILDLHIQREAELLRQDLREAKKTSQLFCEYA